MQGQTEGAVFVSMPTGEGQKLSDRQRGEEGGRRKEEGGRG